MNHKERALSAYLNDETARYALPPVTPTEAWVNSNGHGELAISLLWRGPMRLSLHNWDSGRPNVHTRALVYLPVESRQDALSLLARLSLSGARCHPIPSVEAWDAQSRAEWDAWAG